MPGLNTYADFAADICLDLGSDWAGKMKWPCKKPSLLVQVSGSVQTERCTKVAMQLLA